VRAALNDLKQRLAEVYDLEKAAAIAGWDQRTMMPPHGAPARSEVAATLSGIAHERFTSPEVGRLLDALRPLEEELEFESDDASLIRVTRRDWEKARRVPAELAAAWAREGGRAHGAWLEAREANDFSVFRPALQRVHDVALRWADHMEQGDSPYDAFLDEYEPGMKTAEVAAVFDVLRPELTAIVREAGEPADDSLVPRGGLRHRDPAGVPRRRPPRLRLRGRRLPARPDRAPFRDLVLP
jgi:carboxypeptidase Taq